MVSRQNALHYDGRVSGSITYTYVRGNPLSRRDKYGLADSFSPGTSAPPTFSWSVGGCLFTACVTYSSSDGESHITIPFPPDVGAQVSVNVSPPQNDSNVCTASNSAPPSSMSFGLGHHLGYSSNSDGGYSINFGAGIASPIEYQTESQ